MSQIQQAFVEIMCVQVKKRTILGGSGTKEDKLIPIREGYKKSKAHRLECVRMYHIKMALEQRGG